MKFKFSTAFLVPVISLMLLGSIKSYSQTDSSALLDTKIRKGDKWTWNDSLIKRNSQYSLRVSTEPKSYAYLRNNSDTLIIMDTIWNLYDHIIRYIKIGDKVYPLKP